MKVKQGGWWYTIEKNGKFFVVLVSVPKNHKPNTQESEVVTIFDEHSVLVTDDYLYEEFQEFLISECVIEN